MEEYLPRFVVPSPLAAARPLRVFRRTPRSSEIALLRRLAAGPAHMTEGPVGRCSKRGWCRAVLLQAIDADKPHGTALFELTDAGRALLDG